MQPFDDKDPKGVPPLLMGRNLLARISSYPAAVVLALAVMVVGHNLTFLIAYGSDYTSKLAATGDGKSWDDTVAFILVAAVLLAIAACLRLAFLFRQARTAYPHQRVGLPRSAYLATLAPVWLRLFAVALVLFVLQENQERWSIGLPMPGLSILGAVGPVSPILVFALVSLAFAAVVALFRVGIGCLEAIIAAARSRSWAGAPKSYQAGASDPESAPASIIGRNLAGRAPPAPVAA
jgi:hypothetical protein